MKFSAREDVFSSTKSCTYFKQNLRQQLDKMLNIDIFVQQNNDKSSTKIFKISTTNVQKIIFFLNKNI